MVDTIVSMNAMICPMASPLTVHHFQGQIRKIDLDANLVHIEVKDGKQQRLLFNWVVAPDGELKPDLRDFNVGDKVTVSWRRTKEGCMIEGLEAG